MATFVLLHGSFHAAWNWHKTIPALSAAGHRGIAIDLAGHGRDRTPAHRVTLDRCVEQVVDLIDGMAEKPVLVAHSRNGIVISQAAERRPDRVAGLVYLAAYLVPNGKTMMDFALQDSESLVLRNVRLGIDRRYVPLLCRAFRSGALRRVAARVLPLGMQTHALARSAYREALYHDCPPEITELANVLLESEPNWAGFTPLELTDSRYGRVPRVYVECLGDRAVTIELQRRMQHESPCRKVIALDSSHSPFFSQPDRLVAAFIEALGEFDLAPTCAGSRKREWSTKRAHAIAREVETAQLSSGA